MSAKTFAIEVIVASSFYFAASILTFEILMPVQDVFFPDFQSSASLLFLPHGVRVLTAWLLGWRSIIALLPGVFLIFYYLAGDNVFTISRLLAIGVAVCTTPIVFGLAAKLGFETRPKPNEDPCWPCVMGLGVVAGIISGSLTNIAFGGHPLEYLAFFIGDVFGLFFLMLGTMLFFRAMRHRQR